MMHVLITAGPTYEPIDPVRFIGNRSSGKMGVALAMEYAEQGCKVTLILGPSELNPVHPMLEIVRIETAAEMFEATAARHPQANLCIFAAAVADYTPKYPAIQKHKKETESWTLELVKTKDIAGILGQRKQPGQIHVGFALETNQEEQHAREKLISKNLDMIVLNSLQTAGAGFGHDTNQITIFDIRGGIRIFEKKSKTKVAEDIRCYIESNIIPG